MIEEICREICEHKGQNPNALEPGTVPYGNEEEQFRDGQLNGEPAFYLWRTHVPLARKLVQRGAGAVCNNLLRELFAAEDDYGTGFYNTDRWRNTYDELRRIVEA